MVTEKQKANLIPTNKRSLTEVRENARRGGIKSGEVRREKRNLKDVVKWILDMKVASKEEREQLCKNLGLSAKDAVTMTHRVSVGARIIRKAEMGSFQHARMVGEMDDSLGTQGQVPAETHLHIYVEGSDTKDAIAVIKAKEQQRAKERLQEDESNEGI